MRLYVGNLPAEMKDAELRELGLAFGKPLSATIARYLVGGASKGFGFLEYSCDEEGRAAIDGLDGRRLDGHLLTAFEATAKRARLAGSRRSGG